MKIINNTMDEIDTFGRLEAGEVFIYNNDILMKVALHDRSEEIDWNVVDLESGELLWFVDDREVRLVSAELTIS